MRIERQVVFWIAAALALLMGLALLKDVLLPFIAGIVIAYSLSPLADRMVAPALNESVACLRENIVTDADLVDVGMIFGTGFAPHRGGPIQTIRARGKQEWLKVLEENKAKHGLRFEPDSGWASL